MIRNRELYSRTSESNSATVAQRPTWAEIDLDALAANYRFIKEYVGNDVNVMGVVKADAYGHGAVQCAKRLQDEGADWFGVALPEEGIELRENGITGAILCLGGFWPGQGSTIVDYDLTPVVFDRRALEELNAAAREAGCLANAHIKIDTGMGRLGVPYREFEQFASNLAGFRNVRIEGVMTHFAAADVRAEDEFTKQQAERYFACIDLLAKCGIEPKYKDLANSAGTISHAFSHGNLVRPGGILYGLWRDILQPVEAPLALRNVMSLYTRVSLIKEVPEGETLGYARSFMTTRKSVIATLPIGYHDGFMRGNSNCGRVIIRGQFAPIVGRVSMDLTIVDVTDIADVSLDDKVTIIGQDGEAGVFADEMSKLLGTISYEITCGISRRVPKHFISNTQE